MVPLTVSLAALGFQPVLCREQMCASPTLVAISFPPQRAIGSLMRVFSVLKRIDDDLAADKALEALVLREACSEAD